MHEQQHRPHGTAAGPLPVLSRRILAPAIGLQWNSYRPYQRVAVCCAPTYSEAVTRGLLERQALTKFEVLCAIETFILE
jgi:hypothetical protein